ncbi:MAG: AraC family ligand binding domain-containing protein, partial [Bacillota bacterium]|nr:AraC family ligand binding domain-containing protein [Bacillota bacterium]
MKELHNATYEAIRDIDAKAHVSLCHSGCSPHFHSSFEILYVIDGEFNIIINDKSKILRGGDVAVSLDCDIHAYTKGKLKGKYYVLFIPPTYTSGFLKAIEKKSIESPFITDKTITDELLHCIEQIHQDKTNEFLVSGYVEVIFGLILKNIRFSEVSVSKDDKILPLKIITYLSEHYLEDVTLRNIAEELGYNSYYISKFFNSYFRCSFTDYINMLRLRRFINIQQESDR